MNPIIKDKKRQEIEAEHKKYWKFPERSCQECKKYPCFTGQENAKADFAKYGCINYIEK